jgi:hypothetical protein
MIDIKLNKEETHLIYDLIFEFRFPRPYNETNQAKALLNIISDVKTKKRKIGKPVMVSFAWYLGMRKITSRTTKSDAIEYITQYANKILENPKY